MFPLPVHIPLIYEHLFYKFVGHATIGRNVKLETSISRRLFKIENKFFFMKIPLINSCIIYEYFVHWSVGQAIKGINVYIIEKYISWLLFKI